MDALTRSLGLWLGSLLGWRRRAARAEASVERLERALVDAMAGRWPFGRW